MEEQNNPPLLTPAQRNDLKMKTFRYLLNHQPSTFVHLRPSLPNVNIPFHLRDRQQVVLQLGINMPVPIKDLDFDKAGISGTLNFKGSPFHCHVPWDAVFAMVGEDSKGILWKEDMPPDMHTKLTPPEPTPLPVAKTTKSGTYLKPPNKVAARLGWGVIDGDKK